MKNPERVAALLAELRTLAETDFERHRLDVLERDLTAPPTVENVDENHQLFDGTVYKKHASGYYLANVCLHRVAWQYFFGEIPNDHQIHHVDSNRGNNTIENLQCLSSSEHRQIHADQTRIMKKCAFCGKAFLAKNPSALYCSRSCAHHCTTYKKICEHCGQEFVTTRKGAVFCSQSCARREIGSRIKTKRICPVCGKEFIGAGKTCSNACRCKFILQRQPVEERVCPICGQIFTVRQKSAKQTCSRACSVKLNWQHRNKVTVADKPSLDGSPA